MSKRLIPVPETSNGRLLLALSVLAAVMMIQAILGASPALALSETPDDTYMTNGKVYATALSGDGKVLYIGGEFTEVNQKSGASHEVSNLAAINVKTGDAIGTWRPKVSGKDAVVRSLAVQNGKVFIGGNFTAVEGKPRKNLAAVGAYTKSRRVVAFQAAGGERRLLRIRARSGRPQTLRRWRILQGQRSAAQESGGVQPQDRGARSPLEAEGYQGPNVYRTPSAPTRCDPWNSPPGASRSSWGARSATWVAPTAEGARDRAWRAFTRPPVICTRGRSQAGRSRLHRRRGTSPQHAPGSTAASGPGGTSSRRSASTKATWDAYLAVCHGRERAERGADAGPLAAVLRRALRHQRVQPERL